MESPVTGGEPRAPMGGRELRRNQRVPTSFSVKLRVPVEGGRGVLITGTTREVSAYGATVSVECNDEAFGKIKSNQKVRVLCSFSSWQDAVINGTWKEPAEPGPDDETTCLVSIRLLDPAGWNRKA